MMQLCLRPPAASSSKILLEKFWGNFFTKILCCCQANKDNKINLVKLFTQRNALEYKIRNN
jgi:hypothetical protein